MKKRFLKFMSTILIAAMIVAGYTGVADNQGVFAAEKSVKIYATISDENGEIAVKQKSVMVTDVDEDGAFTIYDALYCTHEKYYKGGAEAGFAAENSDWGLSLTKLWGAENGGSYGYYLNDQYVMTGLSEPVKEGDFVSAFVYTDLTTWSDAFTYFNKRVYGLNKGKSLKLELSYYALDYTTYDLTATPLSNARILVNGEPTEAITNANGVTYINFEKSGSYFISATHPGMTIVAPSAVVFVKPQIGEVIKVDGSKYTVTKKGSVSGKKGKVTISKASAGSKKIPSKIDYAGIVFKVKVVD